MYFTLYVYNYIDSEWINLFKLRNVIKKNEILHHLSADFSDKYVRRQTFEEKAENITQPTQSECDEPFFVSGNWTRIAEWWKSDERESDMEE